MHILLYNISQLPNVSQTLEFIMNIIKSIKTLASVSSLCAVIAVSSVASVHAYDNEALFDSPKHQQKMGKAKHKMMKRMVKVLSLTEEQQSQIKTIREQSKEQNQTLHASLKQFKSEAKVLLQAESFDEQAYTSLKASYQPSLDQMALAQAKTKNAVFNVLDDEQQEKFLKMMEKHRSKSKGSKKSSSAS